MTQTPTPTITPTPTLPCLEWRAFAGATNGSWDGIDCFGVPFSFTVLALAGQRDECTLGGPPICQTGCAGTSVLLLGACP
jgi:hypothetical protein